MKRQTACALTLVFALAGPLPASALSLEEANEALPGFGTASPGVTSWDLLGKASVLFGGENGAYKVTTIIPPEVEAIDGQQVKLMGFMVPVEAEAPARQFLLVEYPADCPFCAIGAAEPSRMVEVDAGEGIDWRDDQVVLDGRLEVIRDDENGLVYRLHEARLAD
jgi:hypothetical protein